MSGHEVVKCSTCNAVIRQCRCPGPHPIKYEVCDRCKANTSAAAFTASLFAGATANEDATLTPNALTTHIEKFREELRSAIGLDNFGMNAADRARNKAVDETARALNSLVEALVERMGKALEESTTARDDRARLDQLIAKVEAVLPYVIATIGPGGRVPDFVSIDFIAVHRGRLDSSHRQLEQLLQLAASLKT